MENNHGTFKETTDCPGGYYYYDEMGAFETDCFFFNNSLGEITEGTVGELPPPLLHAYNVLFSFDTGSYCYLVRFNGKYGVMLDNEFDKAYLATKGMDMEEGLRAICKKAKEFSLRKEFRDTAIVVEKNSSNDGHALSVICKPMMAKDDFDTIAKILRNEVYEISKPETPELVVMDEKNKDEDVENEIKKEETIMGYNNYGTFEVTTEGDCEGKSTKHLGTHTGYIDEIAFALADQCYYSLHFEPVEKMDMTPKRKQVSITFDFGNGCHINTKEEFTLFKKLFEGRDVEVCAGKFGGCILKTEKETIEDKKRKALDKLTTEERILLGL